MLASQASAATMTSLLDTVSAGTTGAATSGSGKWLDVRPYDGEILIIQQLGAFGGTLPTIAGKLQSATDANGSGAADISGATFATNTASSTSGLVLDPRKIPGGFIGYVGTITGTLPTVLVSVIAGGKKHVA